jgi:predicted DNA-binding transcriptional regulator YafY
VAKKIDAAERMLNLLALLVDRTQPVTLKHIRAELVGQYSDKDEAARAQFERDKAELRNMGIPIDMVTLGGAQAGESAYAVQRTNYELADLDITEEEMAALQLAVATVHLAAQEGEQALWKLGAERVDDSLLGRVTVPFQDPNLARVMAAIVARAPLTYRYKGEERTVDPYGMLARRGYWYLIGWDHLRKAQRVFRVDRIEGDVVTGKRNSFTMPRGIDLLRAVPTERQMLAAGDYEHSHALVRVDASLVKQVVREFGEGAIERHESDGAAVFNVPCSNLSAFRLWLFAMVDKAEVLEPAEVRDTVVAWLDDLAAEAS